MKKRLKKNSVIILKGPPGVGKSFTARKLISRINKTKTARISIDEVLHFDQRTGLTKDKLKLAKFHTAIMARSFLREGFDVILEYTAQQFHSIDKRVRNNTIYMYMPEYIKRSTFKYPKGYVINNVFKMDIVSGYSKVAVQKINPEKYWHLFNSCEKVEPIRYEDDGKK